MSGTVTVTNHDSGHKDTFEAGDTFFLAKGSRFSWEITKTLRKYYLIVT